jgi:hypothetical protein
MSDVIQLDPDKAARPRSNLDVISLEQALKDFEIANARVVDLTQRLLESERKRAEIANELEQLRLGGAAARTEAPPNFPVARVTIKVARKVVRELSRRIFK